MVSPNMDPSFLGRCVRQKWEAVMSARNNCHATPATMLIGGDYDGDNVTVMAYNDMVSVQGWYYLMLVFN